MKANIYDYVYLRSNYSGNIVRGRVLSKKRSFWGYMKYLVEWKVHNNEYSYDFLARKWRASWRLSR